MHRRLWLNDPDCIMIRDRDTRLSAAERQAQMDAIALSGGILMYSDDFSALGQKAYEDLALIEGISDDCFDGRAIAVDLMEKEMPEIYYNTAGYLGLFNFQGRKARRRFDLSRLLPYEPGLASLVDVRDGQVFLLGSDAELELELDRHGSRLFRLGGPGPAQRVGPAVHRPAARAGVVQQFPDPPEPR